VLGTLPTLSLIWDRVCRTGRKRKFSCRLTPHRPDPTLMSENPASGRPSPPENSSSGGEVCDSRKRYGETKAKAGGGDYVGKVGRKVAGLRTVVACSKAKARLTSLGS